MSDQTSTELLRLMNDIVDNETTSYKIDASIFLRESEDLINERVAYLYNVMKIEAKNCNQRQDSYFEDVDLIITHYRQKLNMVYDEFYCQYVNIQNELQEAKNNRRIAIINYQKLVNKLENNPSDINNINIQKENVRSKSNTYKEIINKCDSKFLETKENFEDMIKKEFMISSKSLQIISEQNIFQKIFSKFSNIFNGGKKYQEILDDYNKMINNIDSNDLVKQMRDDTVEFVADILEMRGIKEDELEDVRIGGRNG